MKRTEIRLGKVQLHIMQFLWESGEATAREITQHLEPVHALSHSTVQTLLRKLEAKGAITLNVIASSFSAHSSSKAQSPQIPLTTFSRGFSRGRCPAWSLIFSNTKRSVGRSSITLRP